MGGHLSTASLALFVRKLLTAKVTFPPPPSWQGPYTEARAKDWIQARESEAMGLLVQEAETNEPIGLLIVSEDPSSPPERALRIGYPIAEAHWRKGYTTELVAGFVGWCRDADVTALRGGVEYETRHQ
ncbi:MAG: GNAT family N-acetyltransferase [Chromatiales bacterium]|jgi:RimJ/RimL family protein N-acetyltransferase|nr:GNAT family N-acetyltransferase [Chromatiales bacterium]